MHAQHHSEFADASMPVRTKTGNPFRRAALGVLLISGAATVHADVGSCRGLPGHGALKKALDAAVLAETSGLNNQMWATLVSRDGTVCAVAFSGNDFGAQWLGSRVI